MRLFPSLKRKGNSRREYDSKTPLQKCWRIKNFSACKNCVGYKFLSAQKFFREYNTHGVLPASIAGAVAFEKMLARSRTALLEKRPQVAANMRLMQER